MKHEITWQEFSKSGQIVTKRKEFKTEKAIQKYIEKLYEKDNFYMILGTR